MPNANALVECVPNFSTGRDPAEIRPIIAAIESVEAVRLLDVDAGRATNRTVVTFVGPPEPVIEAAFLAIRAAAETLDMRKHEGAHPRIGATDVCPLVPVSGITMDETVELARRLGKRVGDELGIPVYLYDRAATRPERSSLSAIRTGEYEGLESKLADPAWAPDFGPATYLAKSGATVIGARNFLVAYNVNLNTTSVRRANAVAFDIRENGRVKRSDDGLTGDIERGPDGEALREPGSLSSVKGIGWYIEEYGIAQVSLNLTDIETTPMHVAFDAASEAAAARGMRVTGSELVGMVPLSAILDAGRHYLRKQERSLGVSEDELVRIAVLSMGLDDLRPFEAEKKIIEFALRDPRSERLVSMTLKDFAYEAASESSVPGGGSVSAYLGALGAAMGSMVANLSSHKRGWDDRWEEFSNWAERGQRHVDRLLELVDEDTRAFDALLAAYRLPKESDPEQVARSEAIEAATRRATEVPLETMREAVASMEVMRAMSETGLPSSISDAGVGALCARAAVRGAWLNVRINESGIRDRDFVERALKEAEDIDRLAEVLEGEIVERVVRAINAA